MQIQHVTPSPRRIAAELLAFVALALSVALGVGVILSAAVLLLA
jgi:hypothetical protein